MGTELRVAMDRAGRLATGSAARELLAVSEVQPGLARAVAIRVDELRFSDPASAMEVAEALVESLPRLKWCRRGQSIQAFAWAVYGSACRAVARFDMAELALTTAARIAPPSDLQLCTDITQRLAYLRGDQRRGREARRLTERFFYVAARKGGPDLGRALVDRGAILINVSEFAAAAQDLEKSFELLPAHESRCGSRYYLSAVFNLARCRLELASSAAELRHAMELTHEAALLVEPGSQPEIRLRWLAGKLAGRLGLRGKSLMVLSGVHAELCEHGDPMDRALITLDLAELHLERGDPESARQVVLASFGILSPLRENPDAFRAVKLLYTSALETGLDLPTVRSVRSALMAAR